MTGFLIPVFSSLCECDHRLLLPLCSDEVQVLVSKILCESQPMIERIHEFHFVRMG